MTKAENYVCLYESGYKNQAVRLCYAESLWEVQDQQSSLYGFDDGSCVRQSETEFRVGTSEEYAKNK